MPTKILMVCLGNICRSPVAEGILRNKVREKGLNVVTDSAGTSSFHVGEKPDSRMIRIAKENDIDISDLRARQFRKEDFDKFDRIYVMDGSNYEDVIELTSNPEHRKKVKLILNESYPDSDSEVPDPYFGGDAGFQHVIDILSVAIEKMLETIDERR
jgi:protein-tyrosine phosphatase